MGPLAGRGQVGEVRKSVDAIARASELVYGNLDDFDVVGADRERGAFFPTLLFYAKDPFGDARAARHRGVRSGEHRDAVQARSTTRSSSRRRGRAASSDHSSPPTIAWRATSCSAPRRITAA